MKPFWHRKNKKGQFVVEFVLGLGVWTALFSGMVYVGRLLLTQQRVHQVARLGTMLQATGRLSDDVIRESMRDYAEELSRSNSNLWQIEMGRFLETPASRFYRLVQTRVTAPIPRFGKTISDVVVCQREDISL